MECDCVDRTDVQRFANQAAMPSENAEANLDQDPSKVHITRSDRRVCLAWNTQIASEMLNFVDNDLSVAVAKKSAIR